MGGNAVAESARNAIGKARSIAARRFEAAEEDVVFDDGDFSVAGAPDRSVSTREIARSTYADAGANREGDLPASVEPGLESTARYDSVVTYPFGAHIAVVEVDPESGEIEFERYVAVDDCGNQLNPLIVEGQIHGGIARGTGQALYEEVVYDDNGTLLTGSMQDYVVPTAEQIPEIRAGTTTTPSPRNELGVKGIGETGTIAAPAAVVKPEHRRVRAGMRSGHSGRA